VSIKTRFYEAGKFVNADFTAVNEQFKNEAQGLNGSF